MFVFTWVTDFIHRHIHALPVVVSDVIAEASRLVLMTHVEAQVVRFDCCTQSDVHRAKVNANVKDGARWTRDTLLILANVNVSQRSRRQVHRVCGTSVSTQIKTQYHF